MSSFNRTRQLKMSQMLCANLQEAFTITKSSQKECWVVKRRSSASSSAEFAGPPAAPLTLLWGHCGDLAVWRTVQAGSHLRRHMTPPPYPSLAVLWSTHPGLSGGLLFSVGSRRETSANLTVITSET